jgi:hypothetical protein
MTNWPDYLTPAERARLEEIDSLRAALTVERQQLHNRAKLRRHRQR